MVHKFLEFWWNLEVTCWIFGSNLLVEQAGKHIVFFYNMFHVLFSTVIKSPLNLIGYLVSIISSLVSFWRRALFLGISSSENPSSSLTICCNIFFSFPSLDFFLLIYISCFLTYMASFTIDPSLFCWTFTVICKSGSVIPLIKSASTFLSEMD